MFGRLGVLFVVNCLNVCCLLFGGLAFDYLETWKHLYFEDLGIGG